MWLTSLLVAVMTLLCTLTLLIWKEGKGRLKAEIRARNDRTLHTALDSKISQFSTPASSNGPEKKIDPETEKEPVTSAADDSVEKMITERKKERSERSAGFCPKCGQPIQQSDQFCPGCGAKVGR